MNIIIMVRACVYIGIYMEMYSHTAKSMCNLIRFCMHGIMSACVDYLLPSIQIDVIYILADIIIIVVHYVVPPEFPTR